MINFTGKFEVTGFMEFPSTTPVPCTRFYMHRVEDGVIKYVKVEDKSNGYRLSVTTVSH